MNAPKSRADGPLGARPFGPEAPTLGVVTNERNAASQRIGQRIELTRNCRPIVGINLGCIRSTVMPFHEFIRRNCYVHQDGAVDADDRMECRTMGNDPEWRVKVVESISIQEPDNPTDLAST